jgi:hypothetical protein
MCPAAHNTNSLTAAGTATAAAAPASATALPATFAAAAQPVKADSAAAASRLQLAALWRGVKALLQQLMPAASAMKVVLMALNVHGEQHQRSWLLQAAPSWCELPLLVLHIRALHSALDALFKAECAYWHCCAQHPGVEAETLCSCFKAFVT